MNAPSPGFAVAPLSAIGGVVTGLDLARPLSEAVIAGLSATVAERHVLFFEGQTLDSAAHRRFAARFGKLHVHPVYPQVDDLPEITSIETRPGDLPDNDNWHTDVISSCPRRNSWRRTLSLSASELLRLAACGLRLAPSHSLSPCAFSKPGWCPGKGRTEERLHESSRNNRKDESE
jgi:hypothetical protein